MDNRIFNVNGRGDDVLEATLTLALASGSHSMVVAWRFSIKHGLILDWCDGAKGANKLPSPLDGPGVTILARAWLRSDQAKGVHCEGLDANRDHDGHNGLGWRVYCEDWGHVDGYQAIIAVKPAFLWFGK